MDETEETLCDSTTTPLFSSTTSSSMISVPHTVDTQSFFSSTNNSNMNNNTSSLNSSSNNNSNSPAPKETKKRKRKEKTKEKKEKPPSKRKAGRLPTVFPVARIKKIMQTDDDVGKIAVATPFLISKAVELFLKDLVTKTLVITTEKQSKTLSVAHVKDCILKNQQYDFLHSFVSNIPDTSTDKVERRGRPRKSQDASQDNDNNNS
eukprot:TRINITY_DN2436_c1_g2_i1.p1 TRINITY_DN2436_c1_g2~~TRINITY_DN2436_c1_g2_i1.p1  ORF type:complete len:206 (-),score=74.20 TRINITY_DN2436_c1_g2_i1:82-699(-)